MVYYRVMCGRFALADTKDLKSRFHTKNTAPEAVRPNYNAAPTQSLPVIVEVGGRAEIKVMHWGIVPVWAKDKPRFAFSTFNARAESLLEKPMWKKVFPSRRCLVPATGFYEWQKRNNEKRPYYIHVGEREIFAMAGLYDEWADKETGEVFDSFTIITTRPNSVMRKIHDRMPVILGVDEEATWLDVDVSSPEDLLAMLDPYDEKDTLAYPVDQKVGNVRNNSPDLIQPLETA